MITVFCVNVAQASQEDYRALYARASARRRQRADGYLRRRDALCCLAAEALLRCALGGGEFTLEQEPQGKPCIKGRPDVHFSISHSGDWVVLAWGGSRMGVDVQQRRGIRRQAMARRWFSPEEQAWLEKHDTPEAFYRIWTGKESYLKYLGTGLHRPMDTFSVFSLEGPARLYHETLAGGYSLCLCTREDSWQLRHLPLEEIL